MDLKNIIINKFENINFNEKYGNDISITIVLIVLTFFISTYFLILGMFKSFKKNFQTTERCNPFFLMFTNQIDATVDSQDRFVHCLNELNKEVADSFKSPIDVMLSFIMGIFNTGLIIVNQIFSFFSYLFNILLQFFHKLIKLVKFLWKNVKNILEKIKGQIDFILKAIDIVKYTMMMLLEFIKAGFIVMLNTFVAGFVVPSILTFSTLSIITVTAFILAAIFSWVPFLGSALFSNAIISYAFTLAALLVMVFFIYVTKKLSSQVRNAFCKSNIFYNDCD